jgi:hypothetical protein
MTAATPLSGGQSGGVSGARLTGIGLAIAVLLVFSDPVWRLLLQLPAGDLPLTVTVTRAAVCAFGFVALAVQWERGLGLVARSPLLLALLVLAPLSALWAANPAHALQQGLLLGMMAVTGLGLAMRLTLSELSIALMVAGAAAGAAALAGPSAGAAADPTAIGLLFAGAVMAACGPARAETGQPAPWLQWVGCAGLAGALGLSLHAYATAGQLYGLICLTGAALAFGLHALACVERPGPLSFVVLASAVIVLVSGFAASGGLGLLQTAGGSFGGPPLQLVAGLGFGAGGYGLAGAVGVGLGLAGTGLAVLALLWSLGSALAGTRGLVRRQLATVTAAAGPVCAAGAIAALFLAAPEQVPAVGALVMGWTATWAASVSPTWRHGTSPFALVSSRHADALELPPLQRRTSATIRPARAGLSRPAVTRARVAAAMAETSLQSGSHKTRQPRP